MTPVQRRKLAAEKRKAAAAAERARKKLERDAKAAVDKAAKEADKIAREEAKQRHNMMTESQGAYSKLFVAHSKLVADCHVVPIDKQSSDHYTNGVAKISEGETIIEACQDAMKEKIPIPHDDVKAYLQSLRSVTANLLKLTTKRPRICIRPFRMGFAT